MSPPLPDHYAILGVAKDAQIPEIRSAHRKLVLKCHPDKVQDPTLKAVKQDEFQKVQTAYEVLSSEKERRRYDDSLRLAELKAQLLNKANSSAPRKYDVKVSESMRSPSHKSPASGAPNVRVFTTYVPSSYDEDKRSRSQSRSRYYDHEARHSKREASYTERSSKRDAEREREKKEEKEQREKDRRRRERKEREEEEARRAAKKERKEKKEREKAKSKDIKKGSEEKRQDRYGGEEEIFVELGSDEPLPKSEKKKSSSKKHEEKTRERERERERSSHRDEPSPRFPDGSRASYAQEYIRMARREDPVYYSEKPSAPTPPPPRSGPHSPPKDDDVRRSSARRTSPEGYAEGYKEKSRRKASREHLDDEDEPRISMSPPKYSTSPPKYSASPPNLTRTNSVPLASASRPIPGRSKTFANYGDGGESPRSDRGRHRSKHHSQQATLDEESDSEDEHDRRHRERKQKSSKKHRSPEHPTEYRYHVDGGRVKLHGTSYSFNNGEYEPTSSFSTSPYYPDYEHPTRPSMHSRDSGYGGSGSYYDRVKTSKSYGVDDVAYSTPYHISTSSYGNDYSSVPA